MFALQVYLFPLIEFSCHLLPSSTAKSWVLEKTLISLFSTTLDGFILVLVSQPDRDHPVQVNVFISPWGFPSCMVYTILPVQSYKMSPSICRKEMFSTVSWPGTWTVVVSVGSTLGTVVAASVAAVVNVATFRLDWVSDTPD